jgi:signal transduction histidine kinase
MNDDLLHRLTERVKELTALHQTARVLQDTTSPAHEILGRVAALIPPSWQYPEITGARVSFGGESHATEGFTDSPWVQTARFSVSGTHQGRVEVSYGEERPAADEGPFLREERQLLTSLAEMLRSHFQHRLTDRALEAAHADLERKVAERTAALREASRALEEEVRGHRQARDQIEAYQEKLRRLANEVCLTEERQRRAIAGDLHDHIGQALAFLKLKVLDLRSNAVFCGFEDNFTDILRLLEQAIRATRDLTFEISPPVLYEFGLPAAVEWLCEQYAERHHLEVRYKSDWTGAREKLDEEVQITLYRAVAELMANALRHARCRQVSVKLGGGPDGWVIEVRDDGQGFDADRVGEGAARPGGFGLFNLRERMRYLGGRFVLDAAPGRGTRARLELPRAGREGQAP